MMTPPAFLRAASQERWRLYAMEDFLPYSFMAEGRFRGIDVEILDRAADALGVGLDYVPLPWRRALLAFDTSNDDALFQLTPTEERARKWLMVGPIRNTVIVPVVRADSPFTDRLRPERLYRLEDLRGRRVGVVRGFTYYEAFDRADYFIRESSIDERVSLRKLLLGRVDVAIMGRANARHVIRSLGMEKELRVLATPLFREGRYIAFHRNAIGLGRGGRLQRELDRLHADGTVAAILRRYGEGSDAG
ncbi:substrate-binding periplasmic protein [Paenirhodobacter populi]|nr:transporter substrate-binding domain-containing protein [Sinirhodobacter populi]